LEDSVLQLADAFDHVKNAALSYVAIVAGDDFGLDENDDKQKKQIKEAQDILEDELGNVSDAADKFCSSAQEFNAKLASFEKALRDAVAG
jgi:peptidoglycan hydrolase CwlO-like protein